MKCCNQNPSHLDDLIRTIEGPKKWKVFIIEDVLHVPDSWNLFSEGQFLKVLKEDHLGWYLKKTWDRSEYIYPQKKQLGPRSAKDDVIKSQYMLLRASTKDIVMALQPAPGMNTSQWWHERFAHMSIQKIRNSVKNGAIKDVSSEQLVQDICFKIFAKAKMIRSSYKRLPLRNDYKAGEKWHVDIAHGGGRARGGSNLILVCRDVATGFKVLYYLAKKTEPIECIKGLIEWGYTQSKVRLKVIHTDCVRRVALNIISLQRITHSLTA